MSKSAKLIREARGRAKLKGHILGEFTLTRVFVGHPPETTRPALTALCDTCHAQAFIDVEAAAIGGEALENDCKGK